MKKLLFNLTILLGVVVICSCGVTKIYTNPNLKLSKSIPITVVVDNDHAGVLGQLQYLLQANGYNIISLRAAKQEYNFSGNIDGQNYSAQGTSGTKTKALYVMEVSYSCYWDILIYSCQRFSINVIDLITGEIVFSTHFKGDKPLTSVVKTTVEEMNSIFE